MEKDEYQNHGGSFLPPSGRHPGFPGDGNKENLRLDAPGSVMFVANGPLTAIEFGDFSHDISRMPDSPPKNIGHRRVRSEIVTLLDDITFGSDLGVVGDGPSYSETEEDSYSMYLDMDKFNSSSATSGSQAVESSSNAAQIPNSSATPPPENHIPRAKRHLSMSMDGSEMLTSGPEDTSSIDAKKSMSAAKLAELALVDPKRAKRIWANRQSAVRSKERKMRYIAELESQLQTLQTQATSLSAQLTLLQRDVHGLVAENTELKLRLQAMEQQVHMQDALNDALKKEIHHLRVVTGQSLTNGGPMMNFPPPFRPNHQFHPNNQPMHPLLTAQQFHQLQIQSRMQHQQQQHVFQQQQLHQFQRQQHLQQFQHHPSPPQPVQQLPENSD
ncbi:hypothetical protein L1887_18554 [Cichorium endivia]|nr:hypothetical protein L1887_18554 [Cichorium endivia]